MPRRSNLRSEIARLQEKVKGATPQGYKSLSPEEKAIRVRLQAGELSREAYFASQLSAWSSDPKYQEAIAPYLEQAKSCLDSSTAIDSDVVAFTLRQIELDKAELDAVSDLELIVDYLSRVGRRSAKQGER